MESMEGGLSASKKYRMIPAERIRDRMHVVSADASMDLLGDYTKRKEKLESFHYQNHWWRAQKFYVNILHQNENTIFHSEEIEKNLHKT